MTATITLERGPDGTFRLPRSAGWARLWPWVLWVAVLIAARPSAEDLATGVIGGWIGALAARHALDAKASHARR